MNGTQITLKIKCGENGKVFGSVTAKEIADELTALGYTVDKKRVILKDPIKLLGVYAVDVKFLPEVIAKIKVEVVGA